jgi:NOL1/NOP2/sun family putative RNA methylase
MALTDQKYQQKRQQLIERTALIFDIPKNQAEELLSIERRQSVRVNTLKADLGDTKKSLTQLATTLPIPWMESGFFIDSSIDALRDSTLTEAGNLYIQNAASWLPVVALNPQPGDTILDVCAAPGGKTSHIAQLTQNQAVITANDNSRPRLHKLQRNLERLGVENVTYTLHDATRLAQKLPPESFDKILLDAPCSGEGMMRLDARKDFESWSTAHIKRLQQLQKKLIVQAWQLLKPGGTLVYSTCTMAPEENEAVIDYLLRHNDDVQVESLETLGKQLPNRVRPVTAWNTKTYDQRTQSALRLQPSPHLEAFFVMKLTKSALQV